MNNFIVKYWTYKDGKNIEAEVTFTKASFSISNGILYVYDGQLEKLLRIFSPNRWLDVEFLN